MTTSGNHSNNRNTSDKSDNCKKSNTATLC